MSKLKYFRFFPVWRIEQAEEWLSEMEAKGYRLERVSFFRLIYRFKKSRPRKTIYFFTYISTKGKDMSSIAYALERQYSASEVMNHLSTLVLYRITTDECDLAFEKEVRLIYFRTLALESFVLSCMTLVIPLVLILAGQYGWAAFTALLTLPIAGYNLYGLCRQIGKVRAFDKGKRK